jgi:hypothetical protein
MIRSIKEILLHGTRSVFHNIKFVFLMWAMNTISALVLTVPIFNILSDNLGNSLISERISQNFDMMWYIQFRNIYSVQFAQLPLTIYFVAGIYALIQTFFLGGLIATFNSPEKNHMVDFFYGGVKYFIRFLKVVLISIILFGIAFQLNDLAGYLLTAIFRNSENVTADFILKFLRYILLVFFIGVVMMLSDYSKISLAVRDKLKIWKEIINAALFIKNNFNKVFITFLIVAIIGALGAIVYNIIGRFIPRTPYYFLFLSFILQQMLIIFRLLVRMLFYSTQVTLFNDLSAPVVNVEAQYPLF